MSIPHEEYDLLLRQLADKVSHQLRQPICSLIGLMNLIKRDELSETDRLEILYHIDVCINQMDVQTREMSADIEGQQIRMSGEKE